MSHTKALFQVFFVLLLLGVACQKNKDNTVNTNLPPGAWKVSYYFDRSDKTAAYASYAFDFKAGGQLTARNTSTNQSWNGTWSTACDDSAPKLCLTFDLSAPSALRELAEDWLIISMKDTFMHLEHRSGGGGDTEILHFTRL